MSELIAAAEELRERLRDLRFAEPVSHVYLPLDYAWDAHRQYLERYGTSRKQVVFLGMNPGPWGMAQTGIPFGEVEAVRDWIGIEAAIAQPANAHPKRPVQGFACTRSEVSGKRLWGLFAQHFDSAEQFFRDHFVLNWCPLVFMEESGRNRTPDKLPADEQRALNASCDRHLERALTVLRPKFAVGVGGFATHCLRRVAPASLNIATILHPSPASPIANRGWAETALRQLRMQGIWT